MKKTHVCWVRCARILIQPIKSSIHQHYGFNANTFFSRKGKGTKTQSRRVIQRRAKVEWTGNGHELGQVKIKHVLNTRRTKQLCVEKFICKWASFKEYIISPTCAAPVILCTHSPLGIESIKAAHFKCYKVEIKCYTYWSEVTIMFSCHSM